MAWKKWKKIDDDWLKEHTDMPAEDVSVFLGRTLCAVVQRRRWLKLPSVRSKPIDRFKSVNVHKGASIRVEYMIDGETYHGYVKTVVMRGIKRTSRRMIKSECITKISIRDGKDKD